jgi:hypothetical protein
MVDAQLAGGVTSEMGFTASIIFFSGSRWEVALMLLMVLKYVVGVMTEMCGIRAAGME